MINTNQVPNIAKYTSEILHCPTHKQRMEGFTTECDENVCGVGCSPDEATQDFRISQLKTLETETTKDGTTIDK